MIAMRGLRLFPYTPYAVIVIEEGTKCLGNRIEGTDFVGPFEPGNIG